MPQITYNFKYRKNSNLAFSTEEFEDLYFFGIPIKDAQGNAMDEDTIRYFIEVAQDEIQNILNLKLFKEIIVEDKDFSFSDYMNWGYIRLTYMISKAFKLESILGNQNIITYPESWLSSRKTNDGLLFHKNLFLTPSFETPIPSSIYYLGRAPISSRGGGDFVPNYNTATYCTGYGYVPKDIQDWIGKTAAINVYHQLGDLILGAGIAEQDIHIDGLKQEIKTTSSATNAGYGARIIGYQKDLDKSMKNLISLYRGFAFTAV